MLSVLMWDWEVLRGLPRKKEPRMVVRVALCKGGESSRVVGVVVSIVVVVVVV